MKAIILAAGKGKRLRPLTDDKPKCMVEFLNKPLLEWQINVIKKCGITDITVVRGYKAEKISFGGIKYYNNEKFETTNMLETLFCAERELDSPVIVSYGDIIYQSDVLKKLLDDDNDLSVVIDKEWKKYWDIRLVEDILSDVESLKISLKGDIISIGQKINDENEIQGQYIGLMKFQNNGIRQIIKLYHEMKKISKGNNNPLNSSLPFEKSYMTDFLQGLINNKIQLWPVFTKNGWLEMDSVRDYEIYNEMNSKGSLKDIIDMERL